MQNPNNPFQQQNNMQEQMQDHREAQRRGAAYLAQGGKQKGSALKMLLAIFVGGPAFCVVCGAMTFIQTL